jgi:hypothetical protein
MSVTKDDVNELMESLKKKSDIDLNVDHEFTLEETELPAIAPVSPIAQKKIRKPSFHLGDMFYKYLDYKKIKGKFHVKKRSKLKLIYTISINIEFGMKFYKEELELTTETPIENLNTKRVLRNLLKDTYDIAVDKNVIGTAYYTDKDKVSYTFNFATDKLLEKESEYPVKKAV